MFNMRSRQNSAFILNCVKRKRAGKCPEKGHSTWVRKTGKESEVCRCLAVCWNRLLSCSHWEFPQSFLHWLGLSHSVLMSQSLLVIFCQCLTETQTHTHTHFYKIQYNWNNLLWENKTKMREIKWLAWDQAHSVMQDYRLDTVTHTHGDTKTLYSHTHTQMCAYVLRSTTLTNLCKSPNSYKYRQECMDNCIQHSSCPAHLKVRHTNIKLPWC